MEGLFAVVAIVVAVVVSAVVKQSKKTDQIWAQVGERLGLRFTNANLMRPRNLQGKRGDYSIRVDTVTRGGGKNSRRYTRYRIGYPTLGLGLHIQREGAFTGIAKAFGAQDVEVGDESFDAKALIKAGDPDRVIAFLTPARTARIERAISRYHDVSITDSSITVERRGTESSADTLVATVRDLCEVADVLMDTTVPEMKLEPVSEIKEEVEKPVPSMEALLAAATPIPKPEPPPLPPEIPTQREEVALPPVEPEPVEEPEPAPVEEPEVEPVADEQPPLDDPAAICDELFRSNRMSNEVTAVFDERFDGRRVRWSGKLVRVEHTNTDLVFGSGEASKARVELHEVADDFGSKLVHAAVRLPREVGDALEGRRGEVVSFAGRLVKCDPFMRLLYVADGELTDG